MKVAELIAEAELLQQKQMIQNEAEKLKIKERLAKAKARIQAYNNIELEGGKEKEQLQPKLLEDNQMRSIRIDDAVITRNKQNTQYRNTWDLQDKVDRENPPEKNNTGEVGV